MPERVRPAENLFKKIGNVSPFTLSFPSLEKSCCVVLFKSHGISSQMAPSPEIVEKLNPLLISSTENGVQDHNSLLSCYRMFDETVVDQKIKKPTVILADAHASRLDSTVVHFMIDSDHRIFLGPPDTTGVTQVLDQMNANLHREYRKATSELIGHNNTINRAVFMEILTKVWPNWAPSDTIIKSAKRCGISAEGLDVEWMQKDKINLKRLHCSVQLQMNLVVPQCRHRFLRLLQMSVEAVLNISN